MYLNMYTTLVVAPFDILHDPQWHGHWCAACTVGWAVWNRWTGLLDWNTGMAYTAV